jgi:DNA modification methylase
MSADMPQTAIEGAAYHKTRYGTVALGDSLEYMRRSLKDSSVDLIVTSPPFGLVRKKKYGNVDAHEYLEWFRPFGQEFRRVLRPAGSPHRDSRYGLLMGRLN